MTSKDEQKPAAKSTGAAMKTAFSPWDALEPGATVLWSDDPKEGWFECIIVSTSQDRKFLTLRWRDYPDFENFQVKRIAVGVICKVS